MFTLGLAWINAKYKYDYAFLFLGTVCIDIVFLEYGFKLIDKVFF
jgi:hypothetical protein